MRNAKRNNDIDFEARRALPDFESEDEESEEDPSNAENLPVATTSSATNAKNPSQSRATGKSSVKKATEPASVNVASAASRRAADSRVPSPIDPAGESGPSLSPLVVCLCRVLKAIHVYGSSFPFLLSHGR